MFYLQYENELKLKLKEVDKVKLGDPQVLNEYAEEISMFLRNQDMFL